MSPEEHATKFWIPLESNPEVLTEFAKKMGLGAGVSFCDVFSTDLLDMVPRPVLAVILLFPLTETLVKNVNKVNESATMQGGDSGVYFCKQTIGNACGTIGVLHAICNNTDSLPIIPQSFFDSFVKQTLEASPEDRALLLEKSEELDKAHAEFAAQGQTAAPDESENIDLHFICFVHKNGKLVELDGRLDGPVECGPSSSDRLLEDACEMIKSKYMASDPSEMRFTILALATSQD